MEEKVMKKNEKSNYVSNLSLKIKSNIISLVAVALSLIAMILSIVSLNVKLTMRDRLEKKTFAYEERLKERDSEGPRFRPDLQEPKENKKAERKDSIGRQSKGRIDLRNEKKSQKGEGSLEEERAKGPATDIREQRSNAKSIY